MVLAPKLVKATTVVRMDEPCYFLSELNESTPDCKGVHRYQTLKVYRGDDFVEFRKDLGPMSSFTVDEFQIPGGAREWKHGRWWYYIEETVGSLMDIAEKLRMPEYKRRDRPEPHDLIGYYHTLSDRQRKAAKRASTFGAQVRVQRS